LHLKVLASSSKGNCYILKSASGTLLLDCGVAYKQIQKALDFNLADVKGCLLSHSHSDHSKSIPELMRAGISCFMPPGTASALFSDSISYNQSECVAEYEQFAILTSTGGFRILPVELQHDVDNYGYLIYDTAERVKAVYLTDTFYCPAVFSGVNVILVECNYCRDTLQAGIDSGAVHPEQAKRLFTSHFELSNVIRFLQACDLSRCQKIILCHLSDSNSDAERMIREVEAATGVQTAAAIGGMEAEVGGEPY